jgi:transcriptional regulator with XRE-family HTH domain
MATALLMMNPCIRRLRKSRGWSVYRLARESGVSRSYIKQIEDASGQNPSLATLARLLSALDVSEAIIKRVGDRYHMTLIEPT